MICRISDNINKNCEYAVPDVHELYLLNYADMVEYWSDDCEYCLDWAEQTKFYRIDVDNVVFADTLTIGNNNNRYRNIKITFSLLNKYDACLQEAYNGIILGRYVVVFQTSGKWYICGLINGMTISESESSNEERTLTFEENTVLTSPILSEECAEDVVASANGEEPEPPIPPEPPVITDLLAVFDVFDDLQPTTIMYDKPYVPDYFLSVEIDGEEINPITTTYQLSSGLHFIKYVPVDNTTLQYFDGCEYMQEIEIPDTYTTVGQYAFYKCYQLERITLPSTVTSIGNYAFQKCTGLFYGGVTILATTPPTLGSDVFRDTNNCTIYVPAESVSAYKTANRWSVYANRITAIVQ